MRKVLALLLIAAVVALPTRAFAVKVLVNSWDGSAYVVVRPLYSNDKLPNLKSLGALGQMTSVLPCGDDGDVRRCMLGVTKDQHATLLTGKDATVHGVWNNGVFGVIPKGLTIYEILRSKVQGIKMAHFAGKCGNVGPETFGNAISVVNVFSACRDGKEGNFEPAELAARAAALIAEWEAAGVENWFVFVHFGEPDGTGHRYGVNSEEYRAQLRNDDKQLGVMLGAVPPDAEVFVLVGPRLWNLRIPRMDAEPRRAQFPLAQHVLRPPRRHHPAAQVHGPDDDGLARPVQTGVLPAVFLPAERLPG